MAEWSIPLDRWAELQKDKLNTVRRIFAFDVFNNVVGRTPVDTGAARQNWLVTLNGEDFSFDKTKHKGQHVRAKGGKVIDSAKGDDTILLQNNAPYINMLEYGGYGKAKGQGDALIGKKFPGRGKGVKRKKTETKEVKPSKITGEGYSRRAPNGMVGVTMAEANQLFDKAVNTVKEMK